MNIQGEMRKKGMGKVGEGGAEVGGSQQQQGVGKQQNNNDTTQVMSGSESSGSHTSSSSSSSSSMTPSSSSDSTWIQWFCTLKGNEFFCEVDEDYIQDDFNLTGLNSLVPYYDYALDMILDVEMPIEDQLTEDQQEVVESAAEMLYGLIHARYIVTNRGMHAMYDKYKKVSFGRCPRVFCQGQPVLPAGLSDLPRNYTVNVFCPKCHDLFYPKSTRQSNIDGAYFGTTFPHLYLMAHPETIPQGVGVGAKYVPKVYGFRISKKSVYYRNREQREEGGRRRRKDSATKGRENRSSSHPSYEQQQAAYTKEREVQQQASQGGGRK